MLRRALIAATAAALLFACKKADSKEVAPSTAGDSRVAMKAPTDGSSEGTGPVKGSDAAQTGSATPPGSGSAKPHGDGGGGKDPGSAKGTDGAVAKGGNQTINTDPAFTLTISASDAVAAGSAATAKLTVKPGKGYHMNEDFPTKLTIEPPTGCALAKDTLEATDATEFDKDHLVFDVSCTPAAAGTYNVAGKLKFAVCTDSTCDPKRQAISFAVAAK